MFRIFRIDFEDTIMSLLTRAEELVLTAIWMLEDNAYTITIQEKIREFSGESWSLGTIYAPLERLEKRQFIVSSLSGTTPERGGRQKRMYTVTGFGKSTLKQIQEMQMSMWKQIPELNIGESS